MRKYFNLRNLFFFQWICGSTLQFLAWFGWCLLQHSNLLNPWINLCWSVRVCICSLQIHTIGCCCCLLFLCQCNGTSLASSYFSHFCHNWNFILLCCRVEFLQKTKSTARYRSLWLILIIIVFNFDFTIKFLICCIVKKT